MADDSTISGLDPISAPLTGVALFPVVALPGADTQKATLDDIFVAHEAASDPHPGYLTPAEGDAAYEAVGTSATAIAAHEAASNPHPGYLTPVEGDAAYEPKNANIQAHVASAHAPADAQKNSDITKAEIEAKLTGSISSHSHAASAPAAHASTHQPGGSDPMAVDAAAATGSLRTLGTGAQQATSGTDARLSDARTPLSHSHAESDVTGLVSDLVALATDIGTRALTSRSIVSGAGLTGGGDLSADRTLVIGAGAGIVVNANDITADFGTGAGKVTQGDDARLSDARTPTSHTHPESDVTNLVTDLAAKVVTSRQVISGGGLTGGGNLTADRTLAVGAGTGIVVNADDVAADFGTGAGKVVQGNDSRLSDARTPTAHASSHVTGGSDVIASVVASGNAGLMIGADKAKLDGIATGAEVNVNADWTAGSGDAQILNKPSIFAPSAHASSHQPGGSDAMAVDAAAATGSLRTLGTGALQATSGTDSRLSDARTPTSHTHPESEVTNLVTDLAAKVSTSRTITSGGGLTGGGDFSADRTLAVGAGTGIVVNADDVAADFGTGAGKVTQGNDSRLSDARTPTAHAASHAAGGSDPVPYVPTPPYVYQSNTDLLSAPTITTVETAFAGTYTIPTPKLATNKLYAVTFVIEMTTSATPATQRMKIKLGGTIVWDSTAITPTINCVTRSVSATFYIMGTAAVGASVNVQVGGPSSTLSPTSPFGVGNTINQPIALATNGDLAITLTLQFGAATAGNSISLMQMLVEEKN